MKDGNRPISFRSSYWQTGQFENQLRMKTFATLRFSLSIILMCGLSAFGQTPSAELPTKEAVLESIVRTLDKVESVEFQTASFAILTDIHKDIHKLSPVPTPDNLKVDLHFIGKGGKYFYTLDVRDGSKDTGREGIERAFDGEIYQDLQSAARHLIFNKRDVLGYHLRMSFYSPLHMFGFLMPTVPGPGVTITLPVVKNALAWQKTFEGAKILRREELNGKSCVVIQFAQSKNKLLKVACRYTGYFSESDGYFPIAWKAHDLQGRILEEYTIGKLGKISLGSDAFYFPEEAADRFYTDAGYPAGEPQTITTTATKLFAINDTDDHVFSIDPKKYDGVVDEERQQAYRLPK
jgi:hypothetical protein